MHKITDFIINILRWPAAFYLLFSVPALLNVYHYFDFYTFTFLVVGVGFIFFWITIFLSSYTTRNAMQVISHELTHAFFAYLTLHYAGRIRLNRSAADELVSKPPANDTPKNSRVWHKSANYHP